MCILVSAIHLSFVCLCFKSNKSSDPIRQNETVSTREVGASEDLHTDSLKKQKDVVKYA